MTLLQTIERKAGLTPAGVGLTFAALAALVAGQVTSNRTLAILAYGIVLVIAMAFVLARRALSVEAVRSEMPTRVREGQTVPVEIVVTAKRRVSTIVLEETLPDSFGRPVRVSVPLLPAGEEVRHAYSFTTNRRGVFGVGPLVAEWSDPFGLTKRRVSLTEPTPVVVHPSTEFVRDRVTSREWEDPPIRPPVSKPWPSGFEFYGMRDYVSGDDPRRIVWKATARTLDEDGNGRYLVRESEQGITDRVRLILDTDAAHHSPGDPSDTFEMAVRAIASVGVKHLDDGFSVTIEANAAPLAVQLRGRRARIPLLDAMAGVTRERVPLSAAIDRLLTDPRRSTHNVLVTPHLTREVATRVRLLLDRGTSVLIVIVLWDETDPVVLHRAGSLGCGVVEVRANAALDRVFQRSMGAHR